MLDHNNITGNLNPFCSLNPPFGAYSDCKVMPDAAAGELPEVTCDCCKRCCNDNDPIPCNTDDRLAQNYPNWQDGYTDSYWYDFSEDYNETRLL